MNWPVECGVVIPCFNEAETIVALIKGVAVHLPTRVVVDDGSVDSTAQLAADQGATVLRHPARLGKGAALATGLHWLAERQFTWALLMDGDGQHAPGDIPIFFRQAENSSADLIAGNRMVDPRRMPWLRRSVNRWMSARLSNLAGEVLPDSQCGFRLLRLGVWSRLHLRTSHFEVESELLLACLRAGARVGFVPIQVIYEGERTRISPLVDTWRWVRWFWSTRRTMKAGLLTPPRSEGGRPETLL